MLNNVNKHSEGTHAALETHHLDGTDYAILRLMQEKNNRSYEEISRLLEKQKIKIKGPAVGNRIQALRKAGYIKRDVSILDYKKMHAGDTFFMLIRLPNKTGDLAEEFVKHAIAHPDVLEMFEVTGTIDFVVKVCAPGIEDAGRISRELSKMGGDVETYGVSAIYKYTTAIQVPRAGQF